MKSLIVVAGVIACGFVLSACGHTDPPAAPAPVVTSPHPNSIAAQLAKPWRHVAGPVSDQKFAQDKAKCAMMGHMAPVGAGSPQIKFLVVFIDCMKAEGYAPDDSPGASPKRRLDGVR
jgi:hypothetical protein